VSEILSGPQDLKWVEGPLPAPDKVGEKALALVWMEKNGEFSYAGWAATLMDLRYGRRWAVATANVIDGYGDVLWYAWIMEDWKDE